jgi:hypothetical protein
MIAFADFARDGSGSQSRGRRRRPRMRHARYEALTRTEGESLSAGKTEIPRERLLPSCHSRGALHSLPRDGVRSGECRQTRPALIRMYSLDSAVDTDRRNLNNRVKLRALARFHAGPDHVHSERCPVKRATFREEPGAIRILRERLAPVHF